MKDIKHIHAAGREIHALPEHSSQPIACSESYQCAIRMSDLLIPGLLYHPSISIQFDIFFSGSVGIQILLTGWLLVVFVLEECWKTEAPNEVGGLRVGYILASFTGTAETFEPGCTVSDKPESLAHKAAVCLRLRLPDGLEAITTVTHAFIRFVNTRMSNTRKRIMKCILTAKEFLKRMSTQALQVLSAGTVHSERSSNSPLNKKVWLGDRHWPTYTFSLWIVFRRDGEYLSRLMHTRSGWSQLLTTFVSATISSHTTMAFNMTCVW